MGTATVGCTPREAEPGLATSATGAPNPTPLREIALPDLIPGGFSGLAKDDRGALWAIAERDGVAISIELERDPRGAAHRATIVAEATIAPSAVGGRDLEALAWLGPGRFAVGTEVEPATETELVMLLRLEGRALKVEGSEVVPRGLWPGIGPTNNAGIEGLCTTSSWMVAALEAVVVEGSSRFAPLAVTRRGSHAWEGRRLRLTSPTGKLSALCCIDRGDEIEVHAVERHYEVGRILSFRFDPTSPAEDLVPAIAADLASHLDPLPNFEGIEREADGWVLVTDNHHGGRDGPTRMFTLEDRLRREGP